MKAAILGFTGYTGSVLFRLLANHSGIDSILPVSSSKPGETVASVDPAASWSGLEKLKETDGKMISPAEALKMKPDVVFAALPHLKSAGIAVPFLDNGVVIDLSADFRMTDPVMFTAAYKAEWPCPEWQEKAVYGLVEHNYEVLKTAELVAVPGCYPTCSTLPLLPLIKHDLLEGSVIINALSGISGAGRKALINLLFTERAENTNAYLPGQTHRHFQEIAQVLPENMRDSLLFTPHLVPLRRGMEATTVVNLKDGIGADEIEKAFDEAYRKTPFVNVSTESLPESRHVVGSNRCDISWKLFGKQLQLFSVIDNLMKGASGQAVQCMNIRFGFDEKEGLPLAGEF